MKKSIRRPEAERLNDALRALRVEAGLTQAELAERLNIPQPYVSRWERGHVRLDLVQLDTITQALGSSLEELVARYRAQPRP